MDNLDEINKLQNIASDPENSVLVFASAGSGKTKILVDRVLRLLLSRVDGGKILCVTFTKIAALEMKERINKVLSKWVILSDEELKNEISRLGFNQISKEDLNYARSLFALVLDGDFEVKIQTIHSFCQNLVKIFPFESDTVPNFELMDEKSEKLLLLEAKNRIFEQAKYDLELKNIIFQLNSKQSEESFLELISDILNKKENLIFLKIKYFGIENLILEISKKLNVDKINSEKEIIDNFLDGFDFENLTILIDELRNSDKKTDLKNLTLFDKFVENRDVELLREIFFTKSFELKKIGSIITKNYEEYYDFILELQNKIDRFFDLLNSFKIFKSNELLLRFIDKILEKYSDLKKENSLLDYNDLIIKANQLLENDDYKDWVKFRMDGFFDHILIDESQDTNDRQWFVIKALSEDFFSGESARGGNRSLFIIGDDKQSIYSFQGAKPGIGREVYDYYNSRSFELKKIDLQNSFRSLPRILEFVDHIFEKNDSFKKLEYKTHNSVRKGEGKVEIWPQIKSEKDDKKEKLTWQNSIINNDLDEDFSLKEIAANRIVKNIKEWVGKRKIIDRNGEERFVRFGDIMILLRNRANGFDKILGEKFLENSIDYYGVKKIKFSENLITQDLLSLMKFGLLTQDDLNLASLLKSCFFEISEQDLFEISVIKNEKEISLFEALKFDEKFSEIYAKLEEILNLARNLNIYEFYSNLIDDNIRHKYILEYGDSSDLIIDQFLLEVLNFCEGDLTNLQKFYEYISNIDPEMTVDMKQNDAVFVSTIHSAKGLQAPIVIIPDCCFNFNKMRSAKENLLWVDFNSEEKIPIWVVRKNESNQLIKEFKKYRSQQLKDEYWRLFYVALTRAENELYISGFGNDNDSDSWYSVSEGVLRKG